MPDSTTQTSEPAPVLRFPGMRDPEALAAGPPCCDDPTCDDRVTSVQIERAYRYAVAAVEALRVLHDRHEDTDRCPPGECACPLSRKLTAAAVVLDGGARAVTQFHQAREQAQALEFLRGLARGIIAPDPEED